MMLGQKHLVKNRPNTVHLLRKAVCWLSMPERNWSLSSTSQPGPRKQPFMPSPGRLRTPARLARPTAPRMHAAPMSELNAPHVNFILLRIVMHPRFSANQFSGYRYTSLLDRLFQHHNPTLKPSPQPHVPAPMPRVPIRYEAMAALSSTQCHIYCVQVHNAGPCAYSSRRQKDGV